MNNRTLVVSPKARRDFAIAIFWYKQNPGARGRQSRANRLKNPNVDCGRTGHRKLAARFARRLFAHRSALALDYYRLLETEIRILRSIHGARDIAAILVGD
jgi:plasmid stabilization system protein ParE